MICSGSSRRSNFLVRDNLGLSATQQQHYDSFQPKSASLSYVFDVVMPRTAGIHRRLNPKLSLTENFDLLELPEQIICWNYFQFAATSGEEGWDPVAVGSVYHHRSSNYVASKFTASQFRHKARSMVSLAEEFAKIDRAPPRPTQLRPIPPNLSPPRICNGFNSKKPSPANPVVGGNHNHVVFLHLP
jgi:hypothetical protein